jgi:SpoVK/Ycf46/Vps4 family AAA+-type ATPase
VDEFNAFIKNEALYTELGCIYKRAVLLYGSPGTGKTAIIRQIIREEIPKDAVVIFFKNIPDVDFLIRVSDSLNNRLKIFVFEELLNITNDSSVSQEFLEFMDGEKSLRNSFIFGTTNYPEKLPENIVNRPSRWDKVIKVDGLTKEGKIELITHYLKTPPTEEQFNLIKEFSTAAIKEICLVVLLHRISFEQAVEKMNNHTGLWKNEFEDKNKLGL